MTVSDPGAGQQQGPTAVSLDVCVYLNRPGGCPTGDHVLADPAPSPTPPARDGGREGCTCDAPLSSCTPGCPCTSCDALRDSGRDEAREAIVRWLVAFDPYNEAAMYEQDWATYRKQADELLVLPELAKLLRRPA